MGKVKKTVYIVVAFVVAMTCLFINEAHAHEVGSSPHAITLGVNGGILNYSGGVTQELGYSFDDKYEVSYERLGGKGYENVSAFTVRRVVWKNAYRSGPYLSLRATYTDGLVESKDRAGKALVSERFSFQMGLGYKWALSSTTGIRIGMLHNSTAGRSQRNRGIDRITLRYGWKF
jgi:hypothetical protein